MTDGAIETRIEFMYKGFLWPSKVFEYPDGRVETDIADPLCPTHLQPATGLTMGPFHLLCPQGDREATFHMQFDMIGAKEEVRGALLAEYVKD